MFKNGKSSGTKTYMVWAFMHVHFPGCSILCGCFSITSSGHHSKQLAVDAPASYPTSSTEYFVVKCCIKNVSFMDGAILLMEEIPNNHLGCIKAWNKLGDLQLSTGAGFLPSIVAWAGCKLQQFQRTPDSLNHQYHKSHGNKTLDGYNPAASGT